MMQELSPSIPAAFWPFLACAVALLAATAFVRGVAGRARDRIGRKDLLTPNEVEFYRRLASALPNHVVLAQVSMGALLKARERRGRFDKKVVDFVVCGRDMSVVALVELDDRTHSPEADRRRDAMTRMAGYRTLRYASKSKPTRERIARDVEAVARP